jgi:penicillin-insensitive murein endopeptidase
MNPWLMGLLAAAVSAVAGAGATSWLDPESRTQEPDALLDDGLIDDGLVAGSEPSRAPLEPWQDRRPPPSLTVLHPLAAFDDQTIARLVSSDLASLGSMSIGSPSRGALVNGIQFPTSSIWRLADPEHAWGTAESVEFVRHAIERVNEQFPNSPLLYVGDFSARHGGRLKPHKSHQSGRDVDIGYYYHDLSVWYRRADANNLDRARTWALIETLITETRVQYIFVDRHLQPLLRDYALARGEDPEWLRHVFDDTPGRKDSIVRHRWGHATHFHVRFENPTAELTARRSYDWLRQARLVPGYDYYPKPGVPRWRRRRR